MGNYKVLDGLLGLCVGDALGVPVEFYPRSTLAKNPVTDMIGHGTHNQPPGTWSDDSSLAFCLAESLCSGFNLTDIAEKFRLWLFKAYWTPHGRVFDVGHTTREAIFRLAAKKVDPVDAGRKDENGNGNGSLMRILPLANYLWRQENIFSPIHQVSSLTHGHPRSHIACAFYCVMAQQILEKKDLPRAYAQSCKTVIDHYSQESLYQQELKHFSRILEIDIASLPQDHILSKTYVIHSLEAALWCLLTSNSYQETVLKAVNLGHDTDTVGAIAGGLAGLYYSWQAIPQSWLDKIVKKEEIVQLAEKLEQSLLE